VLASALRANENDYQLRAGQYQKTLISFNFLTGESACQAALGRVQAWHDDGRIVTLRLPGLARRVANFHACFPGLTQRKRYKGITD